MPQYYRPSIAHTINPGTRETAAGGSGPATRKRGEWYNRSDVCTDNGRTVSTETRTLSTGETTRRISVWAVYNRSGERVSQHPHNAKPEPPPGGWVQRETVNG